MDNLNLHIEDSYRTHKADFASAIKKSEAGAKLLEVRSMATLKLEWATHNALYALHILRSHTKDVDLNYPQKWYVTTCYCIVGAFVWLFIK